MKVKRVEETTRHRFSHKLNECTVGDILSDLLVVTFATLESFLLEADIPELEFQTLSFLVSSFLCKSSSGGGGAPAASIPISLKGYFLAC